MSLLTLTYPAIDPVALQLGPLMVRWYGLAYVAGLLLGWWYLKRLIAQRPLWRRDTPPFSSLASDDLLLWITLGVVVGGRLGQVLLYEPSYYFQTEPFTTMELGDFKLTIPTVLAVWKGGMAFHGGLLGCALATWAFARAQKTSLLSVWDACSAVVPFGLFFGRIANFINAEHYGRPGDVPWSMVFCNDVVKSLSGGVCPAGMVPRHPSQLYEAALEGIVLFVILRVLTHAYKALRQPGLVTGAFLAWYAVSRVIAEFFRDPEVGHPLNIGPFTAGQVYSLPMLLLGLWMVWRALRAETTARVTDT
jgi:phosphatidylglycerol:prolipoprotein diacylglycerol transferase